MQPAAFDPRLARERCAQTQRAIVGVELAIERIEAKFEIGTTATQFEDMWRSVVAERR